MSWNVNTKVIAKADADAAIDALTTGTNDPKHEDQLRTAKLAAKAILHNVPGPYIYVSLTGHANGVGWQRKDGWANDCINVSVSQVIEEPATT
jgi:hypothetical protein